MHKPSKTNTIFRPSSRVWWLAAAIVLAVGGWLWWHGAGKPSGDGPTFAARRGPLDITVMEGGSLQALESQEIKCEVHVGYQGVKILKIVEEGYLVTEDDVKNGKVLCQLDSSDIENQIVQQEIQYQSALASLADAEQNHEIQVGQNQSDISTAEQKSRFSKMDVDKFFGESITDQVLHEAGLDVLLAVVTTNNIEIEGPPDELPAAQPAPSPHPPPGGQAPPVAAVRAAHGKPSMASAVNMAIPGQPNAILAANMSPTGPPSARPSSDESTNELPAMVPIDFAKYASVDVLGSGEAKQKLQSNEDAVQVAQKEEGQAKTTLDGTRRLSEKGFVPKTEVTRDEISYESARLKVQTAQIAQALYIKYEFPRTAEETLSKYADALRELDKARHVAIARLAQTRARLNSAKAQYEVQLRRLKDLKDQVAKCTLRAEKTGLVVYGGGRDQMYFGNQEPIREGATVRQNQAIITIPDMTRMAVEVKVHESYIKKIKKGETATITVDAFPDEVLTGKVTKVAVLPDSQNRWMNPDLKVYPTTVAIDGTNEWVKPGMSAKVRILVNHLDDVVYVPMQAVLPDDGKQYCYVMDGHTPERREVEAGEYNDEFIEVKTGLKEGERVLLHPPQSAQPEIPEFEKAAPQPDQETGKEAKPVASKAKSSKT